MSLVTPDRLRRFAPSCAYATLAPALDNACRQKDISTPRRVAHFLGQLHHESGGFTRLVENLNYSAERLCQVWPGRFPNLASAEPCARNPEALANRVYSNRLGNTRPGDGYRYRGRGFIQLTGRDNYARASDWSGYDLLADPDLASQLVPASTIAASFWASKGLNALADHDDLDAITKAINGGLIGLAERRAQVERATSIFEGA